MQNPIFATNVNSSFVGHMHGILAPSQVLVRAAEGTLLALHRALKRLFSNAKHHLASALNFP